MSMCLTSVSTNMRKTCQPVPDYMIYFYMRLASNHPTHQQKGPPDPGAMDLIGPPADRSWHPSRGAVLPASRVFGSRHCAKHVACGAEPPG